MMLLLAHGALKCLDAAGHALIHLTGQPFPVWLYKICCATERVHDRRFPDGCACCARPVHE